jgi:uncharacterized membrane protein
MNLRGLTLAILSFAGMIDSLYLSLKRDAGPVSCHITTGCNDVLTSAYSELAGIPISWFGFGFYITAFSLAIFALFGSTQPLKWLLWPATAAFVISLGLVGIQAFVLEAYCEYCLASALLVTGIFGVSLWERLAERRRFSPVNVL